jgi:hypothetical protein
MIEAGEPTQSTTCGWCQRVFVTFNDAGLPPDGMFEVTCTGRGWRGGRSVTWDVCNACHTALYTFIAERRAWAEGQGQP